MRELGLMPCQPKPWRVTTLAAEHPERTPDLMRHDFTANAPGRKRVGDITYVHTWAGIPVSRHSYRLSHQSRHRLGDSRTHENIPYIRRHENFCQEHPLADDCVFHSARGSQYASREFRYQLHAMGITSPVGRIGVCWDNAMAESFFGAFKNELVHHTAFPTDRKSVV